MVRTACWTTDIRFNVRDRTPSLELLATEGERKTVSGDEIHKNPDKTYFAYYLVTSLKKSFSWSIVEGYEIPRLPTSADVKWGANSLLAVLAHNFNLPAMVKDISKQKDHLDKQLRRSLYETGIVQSSRGASIAGIDPLNMDTTLYVPASTAEEADQKIRNYSNAVSKILGSCQLKCGYKIRPIVEKR